MTKTIKFLLVLAFFFLSLDLVEAQRGRFNQDPEKVAVRQTERMAEALALSDAQKEKIEAVNLEFAKKLQEVRKNANGDFAAARDKVQAIRAEHKEELKKYLTEEQFGKFEKLEAERRQRRGEFRKMKKEKKKDKTEKS